MVRPVRVLIADDSAHARDGLRALLATWSEITLVGEALNGQEAVRLVAERHPDVVLIDVRMPVLDGAQATRQIKERWPEITVVALSMYAIEQAEVLAAGADVFLLKGGVADQLLAALGVEAPGA